MYSRKNHYWVLLSCLAISSMTFTYLSGADNTQGQIAERAGGGEGFHRPMGEEAHPHPEANHRAVNHPAASSSFNRTNLNRTNLNRNPNENWGNYGGGVYTPPVIYDSGYSPTDNGTTVVPNSSGDMNTQYDYNNYVNPTTSPNNSN